MIIMMEKEESHKVTENSRRPRVWIEKLKWPNGLHASTRDQNLKMSRLLKRSG